MRQRAGPPGTGWLRLSRCRAGRPCPFRATCGAPGRAAALVEATEEKLGPVDVLVSNAGLGRRQSFDEIASSDFDDMIAVNLRSPFLLAQRVVPGMREGASGGSCSSPRWRRSPAGAWGPITRRRRPGSTGSRTTWPSASPATGSRSTRSPRRSVADGDAPGDAEELRARIPVGRLGRPAEVADLAAAVLGNAYLTNQVIGLDGGMYPR